MEKLAPNINGKVRAWDVPGEDCPTKLWTPRTGFKTNQVMYDWASIVGQLLATANSAYRINGMLLEFADTAEPVTPPSFTRADGISYYDNLDGVSADYLRIPLVAATLTSTNSALFPSGNLLTFFAQTSATLTVGVHGLAFGSSYNSVVYGGALVAIVNPSDRTQDLVLSRFYFSSGDQQTKLATSQLGIEWTLELN